jgi:hypothetical protein
MIATDESVRARAEVVVRPVVIVVTLLLSRFTLSSDSEGGDGAGG